MKPSPPFILVLFAVLLAYIAGHMPFSYYAVFMILVAGGLSVAAVCLGGADGYAEGLGDGGEQGDK